MDKQQFSWLIVRAFGVYLLIQAFMLGVRILGQVFMYATFASSLGTDNDHFTTSLVRSYRSSMTVGLLPFVVFLAAGIYFLRGGRFLMRWLRYIPDARTKGDAQTVRENSTAQEARNMSVKEEVLVKPDDAQDSVFRKMLY